MYRMMIDCYDNRLKGRYLIIQPVVASFIIVMWYTVSEPHISIISGHWV
jgi:hypothetical protein